MYNQIGTIRCLLKLGRYWQNFPHPARGRTGLLGMGTSLWSADTDTHIISQIDPNSGEVLNSFECPGEPHGLTWDGTHLWYGDDAEKTICKIALERT